MLRALLAALAALAVAPATARAEGWLGLEVHGALGAAPAVAPGAGLEAGARRGAIGGVIAIRFDRPAELGPIAGSRSTALALACLFPARARLELCAGVEGGAFTGDGPGLADGHVEHAPQLGAAARIAAPFALTDRVRVAPWAALGVPFVRVSLRDDDTDERYWRQPAVDGAVGLALRVTLP